MTTFDETSRVPGWPPAGFPMPAPPASEPAPDPAAEAGPPPAGGAGNVADPRAEQDAVLGTVGHLTLVCGMPVRVKPLRTLELLALLNIGIAGVGPRITDLNLDPDAPTEVFLAKFAGLVITGLGSAGGEATAFLRMVVEPAGKVSTFKPDRAQKTRNDALDRALDLEMANPHPDDTISIVEAVANMNAGDLQAWGKRLAGIFRMAQRTGRIPASPTSPAYPS